MIHFISFKSRPVPSEKNGHVPGFLMDSGTDISIWLIFVLGFLLFQGLLSAQQNSDPIPNIDVRGKTVILTFDDASASHYSVIPKMLTRFHFGTTFYVCEFPPDFSDITRYMSWRQIKVLSDMGYEIGNHTWHHTTLSGKPTTLIKEEIRYIDQKCKEVGIPKPTSFCYPVYGTDSSAIAILRKFKYLTARTGGDRPWDPKNDHQYYVPSYTIKDTDEAYFYSALESATTENAIVLCIHGVPDTAHSGVSTPPEQFEKYLSYLYDHHFTVLSMREYSKKRKLRLPKANPARP